ncbi:MAG: hypothetical protein WA902_09970, partial [Thermosynechococcaceae cyanobacterium]
MRKSIRNLVYAALAATVLSSTSAIAQSGIEPPSQPTTPGVESPPAMEQETPAAPEETITPESESPAEPGPNTGGAEPGPNTGGAEPSSDTGSAAPATTSGSNTLVSCGPNGAAFVVENVSPGCRVLKVNSPPGQATNAV